MASTEPEMAAGRKRNNAEVRSTPGVQPRSLAGL
jgi:hypothetical protein